MRNDIYDIEKGILIILVVIGHSVNTDSIIHNLIFSFHMPVFFMITGLLSHWNCEHKEFLIKRIRAYVVPYFSWCLLLFLVFWIENPIKYFVRVIYGGAMNTTHFTYPFWFICCLFVSSVLFNYLWNIRKWVFVVLICYLFLWYTYLCDKSIPCLPWSLEVVPFVVMYFYIGFYTRIIEEFVVDRWGRWLYVIPVIIAASFVFAHVYGYFEYTIIMKEVKFYCFPLDAFYPLLFYLALKGISILINTVNHLKETLLLLGRSSLVIMFTHASVFYICVQISSITLFQEPYDEHLFMAIKTIIALLIGCCIYALFSRNRFLSVLFIGKYLR